MKRRAKNPKAKIHRQSTVGKYLVLILAIVALDQYTKRLVDISSIVRNEGIIFGFQFAHSNQILIGASIGAAIILLTFLLFIHIRGKYLYAAIIGGIIGNLIDRIEYGYVIDWIRVANFPVFNIADATISVSVILLIIYNTWSGSVYRRNRDRFMGRLEQ